MFIHGTGWMASSRIQINVDFESSDLSKWLQQVHDFM